eukprot:m.260449 g.260449  ORF g.260449 m.260449 type:complete len:707 (-) comp23593_c0_seq1:20-2140(-)
MEESANKSAVPKAAPPAAKGISEASPSAMATHKEILDAATHVPGQFTTTNQGIQVSDDLNSLHAGARGPLLMEDFHFREKIMHFDHERIPERVVHARGAGAHGFFQVYEDLSDISHAAVFRDPSKKTPVFVRFSTVIGSRGSLDTPRDVRGFAVKFYTDEGVWDLVGNNMPVFFIQDALQFPDLVHAAKPEPNVEIPQAQTAHDTFWDYASLTPEITHMLMWTMSDRALPRSYATMEGFGVNTYRVVNAAGVVRFVKFHWKPVKGIASLSWDECQQLGGKDPDFNRRDMYESIERGDFFEYELGMQLLTYEEAAKLPFDILDATKLVPEEMVPVRRVGRLVLNRNPANFFAETEQVAFCPSHIVPGIDFSDDPLLQGRLFSYLDTQISRIGVNFSELPINRPACPVDNQQRDGKMRYTIDKGRSANFPNTVGGGCPMHNPAALTSFHFRPDRLSGVKVAARSETFADHFSQATLFWNSMVPWEKKHIIDAFTFELNQVSSEEVRQRILDRLLINVDEKLAQAVAFGLGLKVKATRTSAPNTFSSPALSMARLAPNIKGFQVAVLFTEGASFADISTVRTWLEKEGAVCSLVAPRAGTIACHGGSALVSMPLPNASSVMFDALVLPGGTSAKLIMTGNAMRFIHEAFAHCKPILALGDSADLLSRLRLAPAPGLHAAPSAAMPVLHEFRDVLRTRRYFDRVTLPVPV